MRKGGNTQEAPGPETGQASLVPCPTALACPRDRRDEWKLTFFFQMPFTPGTASYSLLMASLQWTEPGLLIAPDPRPFPAAFPPLCSVGSGGTSPHSLRHRSLPAALPHVTAQYVIPAGASSLLLFPPIDLRQCPWSVSLRAGWVLQDTAPPGPCSPPCTGRWGGGAPRATGGLGWHWGAGEGHCGAVPGDLCPGVEVQGPHGAQHLNAPHVLRGESGAAGQAMERRGRALGTRAFHTSSRDHTAAFAPRPKTPQHMPRPRAKTPQPHL